MDTVKVIYITSVGHSGSTLLDVLLNQHSAIQSVGEIMFYDEWLKNDLLCSCGKPLKICTFWTKIVPSKFSLLGDIHGINYAENSFLLFKEISAVSQNDILVDSSKSVHRLGILLSDSHFEVKIIHLVRNGLAVMNSLNKSHDRPGSGNKLKTKATPILRGILRWVQRNRSIDKIARRRSNDYLRIRYEDLCTQPEVELRNICKFIEVDFEKTMLKPKLVDNHNIGGSRWRFSNDPIEIKLDDKWMSELSLGSKLLFKFFAGRLNKRYGYPVLRTPDEK